VCGTINDIKYHLQISIIMHAVEVGEGKPSTCAFLQSTTYKLNIMSHFECFENK